MTRSKRAPNWRKRYRKVSEQLTVYLRTLYAIADQAQIVTQHARACEEALCSCEKALVQRTAERDAALKDRAEYRSLAVRLAEDLLREVKNRSAAEAVAGALLHTKLDSKDGAS